MEQYSTILGQIQQFTEENETSKRISLQGLNPSERSQIYQVLETDYSEQFKYEKQSVLRGEHKQVALLLTKVDRSDEEKIEPFTIDDTVIHYFCKYTRLSLPLMDRKYIDYVFDLLDPYINCRSMFTYFLQDIKTHETVHKLNNHVDQVLDSVLCYITEHPSVQAFKANPFESEMNFLKSSLYRSCYKFYSKENQNKLFISLDINKADYTVLKHYHPEVFRNFSTWQEFIQSFCEDHPIQILIHSKHLRERIFGDARLTKKSKPLLEYFVHKALHEIKVTPSNVLMLSGDETVISYDPLTYRSMFDCDHGSFFKLSAFRLVKLPKYDYFVKEYFDPLQTTDDNQITITRREFKCIPLPYLLQCVKQYQGESILDIDRKFVTESGRVATLDEPIF